MKSNIIILITSLSLLLLSACNSGGTRRNPGKNYATDMVYSRAYDAYSTSNLTADSLTSQPPVKGTVARGQAIPNHLTIVDTNAYTALSNPYTFTEVDMEKGRILYNIQCGICHGTKMDGNGPLYASGKFAAMPANLKGDKVMGMSGGRIYHTIMYGFNMMGSYAAQLNDKERWMVISYILKETRGGANASVATTPKNDSIAANAAPADTTAKK